MKTVYKFLLNAAILLIFFPSQLRDYCIHALFRLVSRGL